jgi:hypothetical protein
MLRDQVPFFGGRQQVPILRIASAVVKRQRLLALHFSAWGLQTADIPIKLVFGGAGRSLQLSDVVLKLVAAPSGSGSRRRLL